MKCKLDKRIAEQTAKIRAIMGLLPAGKARSVQNALERIEILSRKHLHSLGGAAPCNEPWNARDNENIASNASKRAKMWADLIEGKVISVMDDGDRYKTKAFASRISEIRTAIVRENRPWILCDKWVYPGEGRSKYKKYWLLPKENENFLQ